MPLKGHIQGLWVKARIAPVTPAGYRGSPLLPSWDSDSDSDQDRSQLLFIKSHSFPSGTEPSLPYPTLSLLAMPSSATEEHLKLPTWASAP